MKKIILILITISLFGCEDIDPRKNKVTITIDTPSTMNWVDLTDNEGHGLYTSGNNIMCSVYYSQVLNQEWDLELNTGDCNVANVIVIKSEGTILVEHSENITVKYR